MTDRSNPEFEPIERNVKNKGRRYFCIGCGGEATKTALFKVEGATIVERYCDRCASKINQR
jgi:hypothetical protein